MGAQAAALLSRRGRVGDPAPPFETAIVLRLTAPASYDLDRVARSHGGGGLAPTSYDGERLHTTLKDGTRATVHPDLRVELSGDTDPAPLRRVLDLDADLEPLWAACDTGMPWVRATGAGRLVHAPTLWQDLAGVLAGTGTSYRAQQRMVRGLPGPEEVLGRPPAGWGYRLPHLLALAERLPETEDWPDLDDDALEQAVRSLPGFGPFAASQVLPLLGRPRPLVVDGWLRAQVPDVALYAAMGRWGGSALWLAATASWFE